MNSVAAELRGQIKEWQREMDMLEDMIENAYNRIDELEQDDSSEVAA